MVFERAGEEDDSRRAARRRHASMRDVPPEDHRARGGTRESRGSPVAMRLILTYSRGSMTYGDGGNRDDDDDDDDDDAAGGAGGG